MTGREFSEVDIDLLADYVGGALDGTPDEALVATLIAEDPAWQDAHEVLTVGMASVGTRLHALGAEPITMPAEFASRLDLALSAAIPLQPTASSIETDDVETDDVETDDVETDSATDDGEVGATGKRRLSIVVDSGGETGSPAAAGAGTGSRGGAGSSRARRRMRRWAAPITVAASVLAFAGFGFQHWSARSTESKTDAVASTQADKDTPMIAAEGAGALESLPPLGLATLAGKSILKSGLDYRPESLIASASSPAAETRSNATLDASRRGVFDALQRLADTEELLHCLNAIAQEHGSTPITVDTVDFARFQGAPAVIVRFTGDDGRWAWAAGPECGSLGAAADTRYRVKVG